MYLNILHSAQLINIYYNNSIEVLYNKITFSSIKI